MKPPHDTPAVITALNVNGLAVARVLGRHRVPVIAIHGNHSDPEAQTKFVDEIWHPDGSLVELLLHQGPKFRSRPVLVPITDDSVAAIAARVDELRAFYHVPMADPEMVAQLLDKTGFDRIARDLAIELELPLPDTFTIQSTADLERAAAALTYPCILKPPTKSAALEAAGGKKAFLLEDLAALRATYERFRSVQPEFIAQQYIPGGDDQVYFCLQAYGADHEPVASFTGRKLRQWRPYCGGTAACELVDEPRLVELSTRFFKAVGMVGLGSMEFKRDPRDGAFYLIEPTVCRTDWQNAIADANGVPIAYLAYLAALGRDIPESRAPWLRRRWVQFDADRLSAHHYRQRGELGRLAWLWSIRPPVRGAYFALDDLRPFLTMLRQTIRRRLGAEKRDP